MKQEELITEFKKIYNSDVQHTFFCPGRVNLIGEHIDYNGGLVMPCAIDLGTTLLISENEDNVFRFHAIGFDASAEVPVQSAYTKTNSNWYQYPIGVIHELVQKGVNLRGLNFLFYGNLPIGSGLSSSASIELVTAFALNELFDAGLSRVELSILGKKVENEFMQLNSGIMDQFAVANGKEANAILLNCDTLDYDYIPFQLDDYVLAIVNSNKPRKLVESKYNERFAECMTALKELQSSLKIQHLCELSSTQFEENKHFIQNKTVQNRAEHVVAENERVQKAKAALSENNLIEFGQLMYASHHSLQNLYEVSGKELDTIVDFAKQFDGCIGARMTGAGFGGCAIALVKKELFEHFTEQIIPYYENKVGYKPSVFASTANDGVRKI